MKLTAYANWYGFLRLHVNLHPKMNFTRIGQNIFAFLSLKVKNFFSAKRERDKNIVERRRNPYEHGNLPPYKVQILYIACVLFYIYIFKIVNVFHVFITLLYQWCIITLLYCISQIIFTTALKF